MATYPSIYAVAVFDLHNKVKEYLDRLNGEGQIDLDPSGYPYLVSSDRHGNNYITQISRNNNLENFVLNSRKRADPVISWNESDGFQRPQHKQVVMVQAPDDPTKQERGRRSTRMEAIETIIESILKD
jgi:hypothetical protein